MQKLLPDDTNLNKTKQTPWGRCHSLSGISVSTCPPQNAGGWLMLIPVRYTANPVRQATSKHFLSAVMKRRTVDAKLTLTLEMISWKEHPGLSALPLDKAVSNQMSGAEPLSDTAIHTKGTTALLMGATPTNHRRLVASSIRNPRAQSSCRLTFRMHPATF